MSMFSCVLFHIYKDCVLLLHSESIVEVHVLAKEVIPEAKKFSSNTSQVETSQSPLGAVRDLHTSHE